jgi:hypothetical protein
MSFEGLLTDVGMLLAVYPCEDMVLLAVRPHFHPLYLQKPNTPAARSGRKATHVLHPVRPLTLGYQTGQSARSESTLRRPSLQLQRWWPSGGNAIINSVLLQKWATFYICWTSCQKDVVKRVVMHKARWSLNQFDRYVMADLLADSGINDDASKDMSLQASHTVPGFKTELSQPTLQQKPG